MPVFSRAPTALTSVVPRLLGGTGPAACLGPLRPCNHSAMSYDLVVWEGQPPADNEEAAVTYDELYEHYLESEERVTLPADRIQTYVQDLVERYPDDVHDTPWASPPVADEASGPIVYLLMSYSRAEEVSTYAAQLAQQHGLVCYDPQGETLRP